MAEILKEFESDIESFRLVPSDGGRFEVTVDGNLVFSKLKTGRHVKSGEVVGVVRQYIQESK